jgi:hypothetical protein
MVSGFDKRLPVAKQEALGRSALCRVVRSVARLALALLLLALPTAAAAPARLSLDFPLLPDLTPGQLRTIEGNVTYAYDAPSANNTTTNVSLALLSGPSWLTARLEPSTFLANATNASGRVVVPVRLTVGAQANASALQQHTLQVRMDAAANPPIEPDSATSGMVVRVAFVGGVLAEPLNATVNATPGEPTTFGIRLTNGGNGDAAVVLDIANSTAVQALPPTSPTVVPRGEERVVNVSILANSPGTYPIAMHYSVAYAYDRSISASGGTFTVAVAVRGQATPGFDAVLPLAMAAVALAALRRRLT